MGGKIFLGIQAMGESGLCSQQLAGGYFKAVPRVLAGHLNGAQPCGAMKMAKSCKEGTGLGQKVTGLKLSASHNSPLICVICTHNINSCVRRMG